MNEITKRMVRGESQGHPLPSCRLYGHAHDYDPAVETMKPWFDEAGVKVWIIGSQYQVEVPWPEGTIRATHQSRLWMATLAVCEGGVAQIHDANFGTVDIATEEDVLAYAARVRAQIAEFLAESGAEHQRQG